MTNFRLPVTIFDVVLSEKIIKEGFEAFKQPFLGSLECYWQRPFALGLHILDEMKLKQAK